ncbi:MAG: glycosyltransferase family A protein [Rhodobacterales bacterium]|nr:glycosyltransferase family A protein [Rhodobacterales bacterium]
MASRESRHLLYANDGRGYHRDMRHLITLSTIPPRFGDIGHTLRSLLAQKSRPEAVQLYIPRSYRRFPQWGGGLPEVPEGVSIVRIDDDLGPATKVLPAVRAYRGQDIELLYVDDDNYYAPDWAARVLTLRQKHPKTALCAKGLTVQRIGRPWTAAGPLPRAVAAPAASQQFGYHFWRMLANARRSEPGKPEFRHWYRILDKSGYLDVAEGYAGVAIRPEYLDDAVFNIPPVLWAVDDIWISGHLTRCGIPIWADKSLNRSRVYAELRQQYPLFKAVLDGADRQQANLACVDYMRETYGIWGGEATQSV